MSKRKGSSIIINHRCDVCGHEKMVQARVIDFNGDHLHLGVPPCSMCPLFKRLKRRPALCRDCGKDTQPMDGDKPLYRHWDSYILRDEVWKAAGMRGWKGGFLCTPCLTKRLGRKPRMGRDVLERSVGVDRHGRWKHKTHPDYFAHWSYLAVAKP